jgi:TctA family transporter
MEMTKVIKLAGMLLTVLCVPAVFLLLCKREYRAALIIVMILAIVIISFIQKKHRNGRWE